MSFFSSSSDSKTKFPEKLEGLANNAIDGLEGWEYQVAPQNPWQVQAGQNINDLYGKGQGSGYANKFQGLMGSSQPSGITAQQVAGINAPQVGLNDIYEFAGPLSGILQRQADRQMGRQYALAGSDIDNQMAAGAAFSGGSSESAMRRGMLDRDALDARGDAALAAEAQALGFGGSIATGNAGRDMQAQMTNVQTGHANAGRDMQAQMANMSAQQASAAFDLNALQSADSSNMAGLGFDAQMLGLMDAYGANQQNYDQSKLNEPMTNFSFFSPFTGKQTVQTQNPSGASNLNGALQVGGLFSNLFGGGGGGGGGLLGGLF